jgi:radical SAM protein with 4Fe4S-binding SPASM domain
MEEIIMNVEQSVTARLAKRAFAKKIPMDAMIVLTERCHLRCQQCYLVENPRPEMSTDEIKDTLRQLSEAGTLNVTFTGGEPLLRSDIYELIEEASRHSFMIGLFTTATPCNPERSARLKQAGLHSASISLYAAEPAIHDEITQVPGSFEKTIQGAQNLMAVGIRVQLKFLQMSFNTNQLIPTYELTKSLGARFQFGFDVTACHDGRRDPIEMQLQEETLLQVHRTLMQYAPDTLGRIAPRVVDPERPACIAGHSRIVFGTDGSAYPCMDFTESMGNIREQSLQEIWQGKEVESVRTLKRFSDPVCRVCPDQAFCDRCPGAAVLDTGDPSQPSSNTCMVSRVKRRAYEEREAGILDERATQFASLTTSSSSTQESSQMCNGCGAGSLLKDLEKWMEQPSIFAQPAPPKVPAVETMSLEKGMQKR